MAANTGPDSNTYLIPEVELGDTFNVWRDTTNTQTFKLNKLKVYDGISSSSVAITVAGGGTLQAELTDNIGKAVTFSQPVVFSSGVTFNGDVTFNAQTFTVNANNVTIDDYALVLGATSQASDANINAAAEGGAGILVSRGSASGGSTAAWMWRATQVKGLTGIWNSNAHIGLCGASAGLYPNAGGVLPIHGTGFLLDGNASGAHGFGIDLTNGTGVNSIVSLSRYSPAGSTAFAEVLSGTTYGLRPFFSIKDGVNRKTIRTASAHGFVFGTPVRLTDAGTYAKAQANSGDSAEVVGIVSSVISAVEFELTFIGEIFGDFSGVVDGGGNLVVGKTYYLSPATEGKITASSPTAAGSVHKALLIATGTKSALVLPFTGGVLTESLEIASSSSVAQRIPQVNKFKIGDIVRFAANPVGTTLTYTLGGGTVVERYYTHGAYVRAEAGRNAYIGNPNADVLNSTVAQVAGMVVGRDGAVTGTGYPGNPDDVVWGSFDVLMDGWFNNLSGLVPGTEYWLNSNVAGTVNCLEGTTLSYNTSAPTQSSFVQKKLFLATSPTSGYLYSYRGDVLQPTSTTVVALSNSLITDLRSDQQNDLRIGVYDNAAAGGKPTIVLATTPTSSIGAGSKIGNVGIGNPSWTNYNSASSGDRILAALDVVGTVRVGSTLAAGTIPGGDLIIARDTPDIAANGTTASTRLVIGTDHTDGNLVLGYKVRPDPAARNSYLASMTGTHDRSALVIGASGGDPVLRWRISEDSGSNNLNTAVPMTEMFSMWGRTAEFAGKVLSLATTSADSATTLTTKGYVESLDLGVGQTWQTFTTARAVSTAYRNTTGKPIMVSVSDYSNTTNPVVSELSAEIAPDNSGSAGTFVLIMRQRSAHQSSVSISQTVCANVTFIVPNGFWYRVASATSSLNTRTWAELR